MDKGVEINKTIILSKIPKIRWGLICLPTNFEAKTLVLLFQFLLRERCLWFSVREWEIGVAKSKGKRKERAKEMKQEPSGTAKEKTREWTFGVGHV